MTDLLVRNARLVPVHGETLPQVLVDVLMRDGWVVEVRPGLERPAGVDEYDAEGRWVAPGLWDQHTHLTQWVLGRTRLDLAGARSVEEAAGLVADRLAAAPGEPVVGWGHRSTFLGRDGATADLDAVTTEVPVLLISGDGHHAWGNTRALTMLGLPVRGDVVRENEWFEAYPRLAEAFGRTDTLEAYRDMLRAAAAQGVVGLVDLEFDAARDGWTRRWSDGCDLLRVRWGVYAAGLDDVLAAGLRTGDPLPGPADDRLTMGPLKIISDGSLNTRTAWCCEPYAGPADAEHPHGLPNQSPEELRDLMTRATGCGLHVATHAIGDAAVADALAAYEETSARGSVEHAQLVRDADVAAMARLAIRASVQPAHLLDDRDLAEEIWPGRGGRCFPLRAMLDAGVELALGSDAPVSPLDPWLAMAAAVHRSADDRDPWHGEQAITAAEAFAASVDGQPTVAPGSRGDLVLLDHDPLADHGSTGETAVALRAMGSALTVVAGRVVHDAR